MREFAASLVEGLRVHLAEVAARTGAAVLLQLDEPSLPAVLGGRLPTASGYGTVPAVAAPAVQELLRDLIAALDVPVVLHCCAAGRRCGCWPASAPPRSGIDATLPEVAGETAQPALLDALGEVWDAGTPLLLGLVPAVTPGRRAPDRTRAARRRPEAGRGRHLPAARPDRASTWPTGSASTAPGCAALAVPDADLRAGRRRPGLGPARADAVPRARPGLRRPARGRLTDARQRAAGTRDRARCAVLSRCAWIA